MTEPQTPYLLIDMARVEQNVAEFAQLAVDHGIALRPHIKTHRMVRFTKLQLAYGAQGITCAKMTEAELMADAGADDIFITTPMVGKARIQRLIALSKRIHLTLNVDSVVVAQSIEDECSLIDHTMDVRIEINTGLHRTGVTLDDCVALTKAVLDMPHLRLTGIFTYKGANLNGTSTRDTTAAAVQEAELIWEAKRRMEQVGAHITSVSGGSTPTGRILMHQSGITELRPGTYIFNDMMQVGIGAVNIERCAATVICTVISTPTPNLAIVDAGTKALSIDATPGTFPYELRGNGYIVGHGELLLERMYEELGIISSKDQPTGLKIGDQLAIIPNHICCTVNLYNDAYVKETDGSLTRETIDARGCSQ